MRTFILSIVLCFCFQFSQAQHQRLKIDTLLLKNLTYVPEHKLKDYPIKASTSTTVKQNKMPIHIPKGYYPMKIHAIDSTKKYSLKVIKPEHDR